MKEKFKVGDVITVLCDSHTRHEAIVTSVTDESINFTKQNNENTSHNGHNFGFNRLEAERYIL